MVDVPDAVRYLVEDRPFGRVLLKIGQRGDE